MLVQQYFTNTKYFPFLQEHCILITLDLDKEFGRSVANRYRVAWFPSTLLLQSDGTLFDMVQGYEGDPDAYHEKVKSVLLEGQGYAAIRARAETHPADLALQFALAWKVLNMVYLDEAQAMLNNLAAKAPSSDVRVQVLDHEGIPLAEAVAFANGTLDTGGARKPERMLQFVADFPESSLRFDADDALARLFLRRPRHAKAAAFFAGLRDRYLEDPVILSYGVRYAIASGKALDETEPLLRRLLSKDPEDWNLRRLAAQFYLKKGEVEAAVAQYGAVFSQVFWEDAVALNGYAWFWAEQSENLDDAERTALRSIALQDDANTWDTLSMVYWKQGRHDKAIEAEERAISMNDHPDYRKRIEEIKADMAKQK